MKNRFEFHQYDEKKALEEAVEIKEMVGKSGSSADYDEASELVDERNREKQAEYLRERIGEITNSYRKIFENLNQKEIGNIYMQTHERSDVALHYSDDREDGEIPRVRLSFNLGSSWEDVYEKEPGDWIFYDRDGDSYFAGETTYEKEARIKNFYDKLTSLKRIELSNGSVWNGTLQKGAMDVDDPGIDRFIEEYKEVLNNIENVKKRQIGHDRQMVLIQNLENKRKQLHDDEAARLQKRMKKDGFPLGMENARMLLALAFEMRKNLIEDNEFDVTWMEEEKIEAIQRKIKEKFDLDSEAVEKVLPGDMHVLDMDNYDEEFALEIVLNQTRHSIIVDIPEGSTISRNQLENFIESLK